MSFRTHLTIIRKGYKISQSELAQKAGIHSDVMGYEREEATSSVEKAAKIADVLGVSLDYLVGQRQTLNSINLSWISSDHTETPRRKNHIMCSLDGSFSMLKRD